MPAVFVLIWSTGFIVAKFGLPYAPPLTFLVIRYLLSMLCFLVWIAWSRAAWPQGARQWAHLGVTGILMHMKVISLRIGVEDFWLVAASLVLLLVANLIKGL